MGILLLAFVAFAGAADPAKNPAPPQAEELSTPRTRKERRKELDRRLRAEREERKRAADEERRAFLARLDGIPSEEKTMRLAQFNARQKEKLKEFREGQRAKRLEFEEGLKREPPMRRRTRVPNTGPSSSSH